ncbi:hypothetical protein LVD15_09695 [Fulvivirga maritima]|uniref:hypothetical protein n=1 Tax=Fulvivirga maritima TaxID=2904247 RepID=UPI001F33EAD4|nr:hypothetical protein [Fulvivirga maritima]UII28676.1 hypothetical protein LVD15_09695 [Fulvivirga maritima]
MNLTVDFGNTSIKAALFEGSEQKQLFSNLKEEELKAIEKDFAPEHIIVSTVSRSYEDVYTFFHRKDIFFS